MNNCHFTKHLHCSFSLTISKSCRTRSNLMSLMQYSTLPSSTQNPNVHLSPCNYLLHHPGRLCCLIPRTPRICISRQPILQASMSVTIPRDAPFRCFSSIEAAPNAIPQLKDSLLYSRAYWVAKSLIALKAVGDGPCFLYASRSAALSVADDEVQGYDIEIKLERSTAGLPVNVIEKFPHIQDYESYQLADEVDVQNLLKCQLAVATYGADGRCHSVTGLQLPGVLDELFAYTGPLGAVFSDDSVSLNLWAPTAQSVKARIYGDASGTDVLEVVQLKETNGVWSVSGPKHWEGCYYDYEVCVYHPSTLRIEKCFANDPYAKGLSSDGRRTLLMNLGSDNLKPDGWDNLANEKPILLSFSDISIYELHIRDFSFNDHSVPSEIRGNYLAFTLEDSAGMLHLKKLSNAGLTHVHLLPTFQFAGVDDEKENWKCIDVKELEQFPPDSMEQQAQVSAIQNEDGYNWGYNPVLWGVPKGSYATNANGPWRSIEFRKMVQELNRIGLRVVLDVVYNHVHGNGPVDVNSVYDKIVPGYYLRRNSDGFIENSTCVNNTASEHFMVERLIIDDLLGWAVDYKVDGFRFDLMGHLMKSTMLKAKATLQSLSKEENGVDGSSIYVYGEGWDFGEVANNGRGINASQFNISGSGIGSFNDRIRDAMLGGSPFGHPLQQGYATGLFFQPNDYDYGPETDLKLMLASSIDHIKVGMAGNLRDFVFTNNEGREVKASEVLTYGGTPVAYTLSPTETVNYVSAHDNETLFDIVSMKTPMHISVEERCRLNHLATSVVALSQGIPFFHCGDEMLRSKSLDRDSYNSGDWFNRLDFSYNSNNWGVGLPPKEKNEAHWHLIKPRLADPSFKPGSSHIHAAVDNFLDLLRIRYSSPLFRLRTANAIQERVRFHNTGPSAIPGVIVMSIADGGCEGAPAALTQLDPLYCSIIVIFNACPHEISFSTPALHGRSFQLHPVQVKSIDEVVNKSFYDVSSGCFFIPGRCTSVYVEPNDYDYGPETDLKLMLASSIDHIKVGMAGNLRDFVFTNNEGREVKASEVLTYGGTPVAYTLSPTETVNYVSAHDNETLFDIVSMKTPMHISVEERCRLNHLATSVVALSQGIPFFHCGDEMLRSKSLDRDSYNSGDWFNRLDFSYNSNNWGVGLPPKEKNEAHWHLIKPRLADPSFKPGSSHIHAAVDNFLDLLRIRYSSPLFRLRTANAIQERVRFHNTGPSAIPGVIVMSIADGGCEGAPAALTQLDPLYCSIIVIFNACPHEISFSTPALHGRSFQLHPVQVKSIDEVVNKSFYDVSSGCFFIPGRCTSVYVEARDI